MRSLMGLLATAFLLTQSSQLHFGDLLFVHPPSSTSDLAKAILATGNATLTWLRNHDVPNVTSETADHVALAINSTHFVEATIPKVKITSIAEFCKRQDKGTVLYHGYLSFEDSIRKKAVKVATSTVGDWYSMDFSPPSSGKFYCSSLVEYSYQMALERVNVFLNESFPLIFEPREWWEEFYAKMGQKIPPNGTLGSNPTELLHSPVVRFCRPTRVMW